MTLKEFINHIKTTDAINNVWYLMENNKPIHNGLDGDCIEMDFEEVVDILEHENTKVIRQVGYKVGPSDYNTYEIEFN